MPAAISACVGATNKSDFDGAQGYPTHKAGTLLCMPVQRKRHRTCRGLFVWELTFVFLQRDIGWQALPTATGDFLRAIFSDRKGSLFPEADFNKLFEVPAKITH